MINKEIRSGNKNVDAYIQILEDYIERDSTSNIRKLINECNDITGIVAEDIKLLKKNEEGDEMDEKMQILGSKKSKIYERFIVLIAHIKHFKALHDLAADMVPKPEKTAVKEVITPVTTVKTKRNIQDFIQ